MRRKIERAKAWEVDVIVGENFTCAMLVATSVFHDSKWGKKFERMFKTGNNVRVTVTKIKRGRLYPKG